MSLPKNRACASQGGLGLEFRKGGLVLLNEIKMLKEQSLYHP